MVARQYDYYRPKENNFPNGCISNSEILWYIGFGIFVLLCMCVAFGE